MQRQQQQRQQQRTWTITAAGSPASTTTTAHVAGVRIRVRALARLNNLKRSFGSHHAHFVRFLPVLHQLLQTELVLQLPVQIVLEALLLRGTGSSATGQGIRSGESCFILFALIIGSARLLQPVTIFLRAQRIPSATAISKAN